MELPRSEGSDIAEKAAVNRHFATIDLLMRLLDELHVSSPFSLISKALRLAWRNYMFVFVLCQFLAVKKKFSLSANYSQAFGLLSRGKSDILTVLS